MSDLTVVTVPQRDPRLGRQVVHDQRSREFPRLGSMVDTASWHTRSLRVYDPLPNPNQTVGCCTGVAKCSQLNTSGNRVMGRVLGMADAERIYSANTKIDPWPGEWPPTDTGSSGLASAATAKALGLGGEYRWLFGGADEVVQAVMDGEPVSVGTWWYDGMFRRDSRGRVEPTGAKAGGHQYLIRGYDEPRDELIGRCWWGTFRDFRLSRTHLAELLDDNGDAHVQRTA